MLDVETQRSADEVGGWDRADRMGLAVAVTQDLATGEVRVYTEERVEELLDDLAAAALIKPGLRRVYATCSFLRAESQDIVAAFLAAHPRFGLVPANQVLEEQHIALDTGEFLQL